WGRNDFLSTRPEWSSFRPKEKFPPRPQLNQPTMLAVGYEFACALDRSGVKCWGQNDHGQTQVPPLKNPKFITAEAFTACAIDDTGLKCWGKGWEYDYRKNERFPHPLKKNPKMVSIGYEAQCGLDEDGATCWRTYGLKIPALLNPQVISTGTGHACALDELGISCWRFAGNDFELVPVPSMQKPTQLSTGKTHACALAEGGIVCWKLYSDAPVNWECPEEIQELVELNRTQFNFNLDHLDLSFDKISRFVYQYKAHFFNSLASEIKKISLGQEPKGGESQGNTRYFYLELVGPILETTQSEIIQEKVLPNYQSYLSQLRSQMGISSFNEIELNSSVFRSLLISTIEALRASKDYLLIEEESRSQEKMLSALGVLLATSNSAGFNQTQAKEMLFILESHKELIQSFNENLRLEGFGALIEKVRGYLHGKS
ncbi:MAG: RCC1 domain-containing protein, partial [Deltaproteobacteria bacterium]